MKYIYIYFSILTLIFSLVFSSCEKFLDKKTLKSLTIPSTIKDLDALLNATGKINLTMPPLLEMGTDNYILSESAFNNLTAFERDNYSWAPYVDYQLLNVSNEWTKPYEIVLIANTVLEYLPKVVGTVEEKNLLRGEALFLRSWSFFHLAQLYSPVFNPDSDNEDLGIPLRINSDLNVKSTRATVKETYELIVSDLEEASKLLTNPKKHVTRPNRTAALAFLARVYLSMSDYKNAGRIADEVLQSAPTIMDYNLVKVDNPLPFVRFNDETLYYSMTSFMQILNPSLSFINPELIALYQEGDLRKRAFFAQAQSTNFSFKGSYDGSISGIHFVGLTTAELYLILAESLVREDKVSQGIQKLNVLLANRWDSKKFIPLSITNQEEALEEILKERRKELVFRGVRWTDIR